MHACRCSMLHHLGVGGSMCVCMYNCVHVCVHACVRVCVRVNVCVCV